MNLNVRWARENTVKLFNWEELEKIIPISQSKWYIGHRKKLNDQRSFTVPWTVDNSSFCKTLFNWDASIDLMSLVIYTKLADWSITHLKGIRTSVLVKFMKYFDKVSLYVDVMNLRSLLVGVIQLSLKIDGWVRSFKSPTRSTWKFGLVYKIFRTQPNLSGFLFLVLGRAFSDAYIRCFSRCF